MFSRKSQTGPEMVKMEELGKKIQNNIHKYYEKILGHNKVLLKAMLSSIDHVFDQLMFEKLEFDSHALFDILNDVKLLTPEHSERSEIEHMPTAAGR